MTVLAHGADTRAESLTTMALLVGVGLLAGAYGRGVHELWRRRGAGVVIPGWRVVAFGLGLLVPLIAVTGPVHELAEASLTGHMSQHMLLLVVAGPLLGAGAPGLPLALAAPAALRRCWARARVGPTGRLLRRAGVLAVCCGLAQAVSLWLWHLPGPYTRAERDPWIHAVEHACFLATAAAFWAAILGSRRHRLPAPLAVLMLFASMLPASALGAVFTLAPQPIYPDATDLVDQQRAGLLMWVPMDVLILGAALALFLRWFAPSGPSTPADPPATCRLESQSPEPAVLPEGAQ
ncbi:cytochrome c oxidase assembly protein [Micromonospora zhanjiangensis]|uniref:Cytochrome c oxidase assembly protein n=1 Tax=Micromonospora zhanjiangensis TaxID=1522057 RepID=A0ABV8KPA3_9ACTN